MEANKVYLGDCLELMKDIPDGSIDMILCDLPYGTTACKWDQVIPFDLLWPEYHRVIKNNGAIVLTASQPFTSALVMSNPKMFRYEWIYEKSSPTNPIVANFRVMPRHENILIFYNKKPTYNPQKTKREESKKRNNKKVIKNETDVYDYVRTISKGNTDLIHPSSIQKFNRENGLHPTQKPVKLFEYLIKTYSNEGETILDNCAGSGTTAIACLNTKRNYICIEKEPEYFDIIEGRIKEYKREPVFF